MTILFDLGYGVRRAVFEAQSTALGGRVPFTLESAVEYYLARRVYDEGRLPVRDENIEYPGGVNLRRTYTLGAEYVYAGLAHLMGEGLDLEERFRIIERGWFCMGIPLLALWIWWLTGSVSGSALGGTLYAVALAAVIRSTGQEISRENFAIPLLIAHLALQAGAERRGPRFRLLEILSAVCLALAAATWDLVQFYLILWGTFGLWHMIVGERWEGSRSWCVQWIVLTGMCLLNPYMRAHGVVFSPGMLAAHAGGVLWALERKRLGLTKGRRAMIVVLLVMLGWIVGRGVYQDSYGHFMSLLWAKLRFLNHKPLDPSRLNFEQRILWVPALESGGWRLTFTLMPVMLLMSLWSAAGILRPAVTQRLVSRLRLLFFFCSSLVAFVFFVRLHVFLAIFGAVLIGTWASVAGARAWWRRLVFMVLLAVGSTVEACHTLGDPLRWGRPDTYYKELDELTAWLRGHAAGSPVLANFGVSGSILAYGACPIILHPKFESPEIRRRVRRYGERLFGGSERAFREWAGKYGARYYVYCIGEFSDVQPDRQMRYCVGKLRPPKWSAARKFEFHPETCRFFVKLWENRKYRVFRIISHYDQEVAVRKVRMAWDALERGDLLHADELAQEALGLDPFNRDGMNILRHVDGLRQKGFSYRPPGTGGE